MECIGHPLDELGILAAAICTGKNVGIMLKVMEFWTTRDDNDWEKCDIYFAYIGDKVFVPIERLDMSLLNRVAQQVPLYDIPHVKPKGFTRRKVLYQMKKQQQEIRKEKMVEENRRQVNRNPK